MKSGPLLLAALILAAGLSTLPGFVSAQQGTQQETKVASANDPAPAAAGATGAAASSHSTPSKLQDEDALRIEGEKRFHANCGRCHQAPHKFPPRMMATIVRHMRVRATITDEDMRVILHYMRQ
ncbi:MAG: cytochrome c [Candidatus Acidiferrales bacterium]|jgi:mono/diheme cytochrome c family protein